ncbi:MAG TPA: nucleotidyl transferase AbiEii/AbiGii toxin family protein [Polyangia bacterium]
MRPRGIHLETLTDAQKKVLQAAIGPAQAWGAYLAGGAATGLHIGHRRSEDFDWFTPNTIKPVALLKRLEETRLPIEVTQNDEGTFLGYVEGVKFSVFRYRYPLVAALVPVDGAQLASLQDIAAMKLVAVVQRAEKRDYVDLHALLTERKIPLGVMFRALVKKAPQLDPTVAYRALGYFVDAEKTTMPQMLNATTWEKVKADLTREVNKLDPSVLFSRKGER